ncbi:hypothetical protein POM88_047428 [Heracleum sosnowskyi]|uniref:Rhodanese domain-containing protein n=1 Tax=Heracleum sosnowskyi TaxID=360622 RepID=A0AAD8GS61_9APIA|nr:hypothetical protein POM88_047428 [Heracleum sosnowskyi]
MASAASDAIEKVYQGQAVTPITFQARFQPHLVWNLEQVHKNMEENSHQLVDARSKPRFDGTAAEPRKGIRSGHVPGSNQVDVQASKHDEDCDNDRSNQHISNQGNDNRSTQHISYPGGGCSQNLDTSEFENRERHKQAVKDYCQDFKDYRQEVANHTEMWDVYDEHYQRYYVGGAPYPDQRYAGYYGHCRNLHHAWTST